MGAQFPLLYLAAIGSALVGGLFFALSAIVKQGLARLPPDQAIAAIQAIDAGLPGTLFFTLVDGLALISVALLVIAWQRGGDGPAIVIGIGSGLYLTATVLVTLAFSLGLDSQLATLAASACLAAAAAFTGALAAR